MSSVPFSTPTGTLSRPVNSDLTKLNVTLAGKIGTALALNVVFLRSSSILALITSLGFSLVYSSIVDRNEISIISIDRKNIEVAGLDPI